MFFVRSHGPILNSILGPFPGQGTANGNSAPDPIPGGVDGQWKVIPGDQCELAHTRLSLRAIFSTRKGMILAWGDSGDLVSQKREEPDARSQGSFDKNEGGNACSAHP
jgi:hypothetical protein